MGAGKTITAWKVVQSMENVMHCYIRVDNNLLKIPQDFNFDPGKTISAILTFLFTHGEVAEWDLSLIAVGRKFKEDLKNYPSRIILHKDEFQSNYELCRAILRGCHSTLMLVF
jgi:hypothetical protein